MAEQVECYRCQVGLDDFHAKVIDVDDYCPECAFAILDLENERLQSQNANLLQAVNDKDQELFESQELVAELLEALEAFVKVHRDDNVDICRDAGVSPSGCDCAECIRGEKAIRKAKEK